MKIKTKQDMETHNRLQRDVAECQAQFDRLYNDRLRGEIDSKEYEKYKASFLSEIRIAELTLKQFVVNHK